MRKNEWVITQNEKNSKKEKSNRCLTSGELFRWDVETPAEWLDTECTAEDILPPDTLLTERILGDEELDMVTASTASSAPKIPLTRGVLCCKSGCFCAISSHDIMWAIADKYKDDLGVFRALFWASYSRFVRSWLFELLYKMFSIIVRMWVQFMQQPVERFTRKSNDA